MVATFCLVSIVLLWYVRSQPQHMKEITGTDGAPMVLIHANYFRMGSDDGESNEKPSHSVYLDAFYMDKYEVTTLLYAKFLANTERERPFKWGDVNLPNDGNRPIVGVNWHDAQTYCQWVGKRLPTEAEWEKAAHGTDGRTYPWGNEDPGNDRGNFDRCCSWNGYSTLAIVGSFEAGKSPYNVYDLAGNVSEWTADWYDSSYYKNSPVINPKGPSLPDRVESFSLDFQRKVVRGASWVSGPQGMRSTYRGHSAPMNRHGDVGFRCAKEIAK